LFSLFLEESALGSVATLPPTVPGFTNASDYLTILTTTNPAPTNPSTDALKRIFESYAVVDGLSDARKLICFDEPWPAAALDVHNAYAKFKANVVALTATDPRFRNAEAIFVDNGHWLHLAGTVEK
ncbi:unnamed protein product, partial [Phaeothamnion confervicola]